MSCSIERRALWLILVAASLALGCRQASDPNDPAWTAAELRLLSSLWIGSLPPLPPDPTNRVADDPQAAALGQRLFFDPRLSSTGTVSCASCHDPARGFQDGRKLGHGVGVTSRRTMSLTATARTPFLFWDGRKDSQWAQALAPLESQFEHGGDRTQYAHVVATHHRREYELLFGPLPPLERRRRFPAHAGPTADPTARAAWLRMKPADCAAVTRVFVNLGKALAAFERRIEPGPSRFDRHVGAILGRQDAAAPDTLSPLELQGLRLFVGKAQCVSCHGGPLLTDHAFHNTGVPSTPGKSADFGRFAALPRVIKDEFNCRGAYSDADPGDCAELRFILVDASMLGAFRAPSLRNVAERAPFMHAGQLPDLASVLAHYNQPHQAPVGRNELRPLGLTPAELMALEAFLHTLSGPITWPGASTTAALERHPP